VKNKMLWVAIIGVVGFTVLGLSLYGWLRHLRDNEEGH